MRKIIVAGVVTALGVAITVPTVTAKGKPDPTFRVLAKAHASQDGGLPPLTGELAELVVPETARYVGKVGKSKVYLAAGVESTTCFLTADSFGVGGGCIEQKSLTKQATYVGSSNGESVDLVIPVPDGYSEAEVDGKKLKAKDNVVLVSVPKKNGRIKVKGANGTLETELVLEPVGKE